MCSNYFPTRAERLPHFQVPDPADHPWQRHIWRGYVGPMIRLGADGRELVLGEFGLLPFWSKERKIKYATFNARSETVATTASFKTPWAKQQRCIIPADYVVEPDWRSVHLSGKSIATAIGRTDGDPMGIAGLWDRWLDRTTGEVVHSFTMLTINADSHPLMRQFHRPEDEKRMVVILPENDYDAWLHAPISEAVKLLQPYPAEALRAEAVSTLLDGRAPGTTMKLPL